MTIKKVLENLSNAEASVDVELHASIPRRKKAPKEVVFPPDVPSREALMVAIYQLALKGNIAAARLYFKLTDVNPDKDSSLTIDKALMLVQTAKEKPAE